MKINFKRANLGALILVVTINSAPALVPSVISTNWSGSQLIPDNNASGVAFTFYLNAGGPAVITNVTVDLNLSGGWDGDLYAYLSHGSGLSVLLNRVGRTAGTPNGNSLAGLNVSLADSFVTDIHTFAGNPLFGNLAPDGRNVNPFGALDTNPRNAMLGNFAGQDPNGVWTLFFADVSPLALSTVQSWTVTVATVVPEPGCASVLGLALALGLTKHFRYRR